MGLSDGVARAAALHAHALVVEVPGWWRTRAAIERAALTRGWSLAFSPADADVLVVCGEPGPRLDEAVELVWQQLAGPRVRVDIRRYDDVAARLDEAYLALLDTERHRRDARRRPEAVAALVEAAESSSVDGAMDRGGHGAHGGQEVVDQGGPGDHRGMGHGGHEGLGNGDGTTEGRESNHGGHEGMDHGGMDHAGMGHGGHGDMDMSPGGIPLAVGGEDRDGLEMDVMTVRLGPVLPHWPAGLVLRCSLQGDVITTVRAELVDDAWPAVTELATRARRLDNVVSVLALAGWDGAAARGRRLRDAVLEHGWSGVPDAELVRLRARVRRSRLLRWSLRGVAPLGVEEVRHHGLPLDVVGDSYERLIRMLDQVVAPGAEDDHERVYSAQQLAQLVVGLDLATARLAVASLDVQGVRTDHMKYEVSHG